jgi:hypothetical protein
MFCTGIIGTFALQLPSKGDPGLLSYRMTAAVDRQKVTTTAVDQVRAMIVPSFAPIDCSTINEFGRAF